MRGKPRPDAGQSTWGYKTRSRNRKSESLVPHSRRLQPCVVEGMQEAQWRTTQCEGVQLCVIPVRKMASVNEKKNAANTGHVQERQVDPAPASQHVPRVGREFVGRRHWDSCHHRDEVLSHPCPNTGREDQALIERRLRSVAGLPHDDTRKYAVGCVSTLSEL
jgi:hypothetical protein